MGGRRCETVGVMTPSTRDLLRRIGLALAVLLAGGAIVLGVTRSETGPRTEQVDQAIELQVPRPGELALRQAQVGVDLAPGYTGVLLIDGVEIPLDQYTVPNPTDLSANPLGQVFFAPGEGKEFEEFAEGDHTVTVIYWRADEGRESARSLTWSFSVA